MSRLKHESYIFANGVACGFFACLALCLLIGGLDVAGKLDPILDYFGFK